MLQVLAVAFDGFDCRFELELLGAEPPEFPGIGPVRVIEHP